MNTYFTKTTIAAIATPKGIGGIGVIRISGPESLDVAKSLFVKKDMKAVSDFTPRHLYNGYIVDGENEIIDEVLLVYMKGPNSYTAEDVVEIQAHAGFFILKSILKEIFEKGVLPAEAGEFTKRAYLNGRIDLTQAEAVADIINAQTAKSHKAALSQIKGSISKRVSDIRKTVRNLLTQFEAVLDFPDDVGDIINTDEVTKTLLEQVKKPLESLIENYENGHILRDGVKLAIIGVPNVGKSSLMNCLIERDRSIVTHIPGTTRDVIEEPFNLNGVPVVLTDTAGIHETCDPVERIGIERTIDAMENADIVLFMVDGSKDINKNDLDIFKKIDGKKLILAVNKKDIIKESFENSLKPFKDIDKVYISAKYGDGINDLKKRINDLAFSDISESDDYAVPNLRQKLALERSFESLANVFEGIKTDLPFEMISMDLMDIHGMLGEILGITEKTDILDSIFSDFCIGK